MLTNNVLIKKVRTPVYKTWIWIVISRSIFKSIDTVEDMIDHRIPFPGKSAKAYVYAYESAEGKYRILLFLNDRAKPGTIAHECNHAKNIVLSWHGVKPSFSNDEHESYLLDWAVDLAHDTVSRFKKTIA